MLGCVGYWLLAGKLIFPGSRMVYLRLDSDQNVLLVGEIAWFMAEIELRLQKPGAISREMVRTELLYNDCSMT